MRATPRENFQIRFSFNYIKSFFIVKFAYFSSGAEPKMNTGPKRQAVARFRWRDVFQYSALSKGTLLFDQCPKLLKIKIALTPTYARMA